MSKRKGECNHKQCAICLRRECQAGVGDVSNFGNVLACGPCVRKSVRWAQESAMKWGGSYADERCGLKANRTTVADGLSQPKAAQEPVSGAAPVVAIVDELLTIQQRLRDATLSHYKDAMAADELLHLRKRILDALDGVQPIAQRMEVDQQGPARSEPGTGGEK